MRLPRKFLALPTSLLLLISNSITVHAGDDNQSPAQWPYNRPEDPSHQRRSLEAVQDRILAGHSPVAVRKMSEDESEMFFPEYWGFLEQIDQSPILSAELGDTGVGTLRKEFEEEEAWLLANDSVQLSFRPAFAVHAKQGVYLSERDTKVINAGLMKSGRDAAHALALLEKRDFVCPTGTSACSNAPNLCCATGEACVSVTDTGLGSLGCCPSGAICVGNITCAVGNTPCASDIGGGCCIPGYVCAGLGCVPSAVTVITTLVQTLSSSSTLQESTTIVTPPESTTVLIVMTSTATSTSVSISNTDIVLQTTTTTASAPVRATNASDTTEVTTTSDSITSGPCPTGFYACSAYYVGGCCRTGRDCDTTDCPSTASTTLINSGVTIVVPLAGAATTTASGTCATGWYSCDGSLGGGCCLSGWSCGIESCTSVGASSTDTEPKGGVFLNGGTRSRMISPQLLGMLYVMISALLVL